MRCAGHGVKLVGLNSVQRPASIYPASTSMSQDRWPVSPEERAAAYEALKTVNIVDVAFAEGVTRGFAYCYSGERLGKYNSKVEECRCDYDSRW